VGQCLRETHEALSGLLHHEHASLALAQRCSALGAGAPLFTTLLNYRYMRTRENLAGWEGTEALGGKERTNYPVMLSIDDMGEGFALVAQITQRVGAQRLCGYAREAVASLVKALTGDAAEEARHLRVMDSEEHDRLLQWGANVQRYPDAEPVHRMFERQAQARPEAVALVSGDRSLSYRELNAQANRLAHRLQREGISRGAKVGLCVERDVDMVVGVLAILKAGAAYVPLDPEHPRERLAAMARASGIALLLTQSRLGTGALAQLLELDCLDLSSEPEHDPAVELHGEHLAYVIHTSGSTGKPKGVMVRHRALSNFILGMQAAPGLRSDDVLVAVTSLSFDIAALELYLPLACGARIVLADRPTVRDGRALSALIASSGATCLQSTPAGWRLLRAAGWPGVPLRGFKGLCGGEALQGDLADDLRGLGIELWNMYGPTETTIWSSAQQVDGGAPHIGSAIADTRLLVLDAALQPVPHGVAGELYLGGEGLARGYLDQPGLSAERFVADPFGEQGERLYRTGDLVRWTADGRLHYLSRVDHQVKVRGFRIELGEIEAQLLAQPGIREAVAVAKQGPGGTRLVAYVSCKAREVVDAARSRSLLAGVLPDYMVPAAIVVLEALPLNMNGKVDRKQLPDPQTEAQEADEPPQGEAEQALAAIWADVLGVEEVGRNDDFFGLGGHSLLAMQLVARVQGGMRAVISIQDVFRNPVLKDMAVCMRSSAARENPDEALSSVDSFIANLEETA
jgi:amino acid adenylation domain-containing protein